MKSVMRNYLLMLNGKAIADYYTRGRAENAFRRRMLHLGANDYLSLFSLPDGRTIASSI